jgi:hypothetical protein
MTPHLFWKRAQHAFGEPTSGLTAQNPPQPLGASKARNKKIVVQPLTEATETREKSREQSLENGGRHDSVAEEDHYAHGVKLAIITVCVALSVLLVALVSR